MRKTNDRRAPRRLAAHGTVLACLLGMMAGLPGLAAATTAGPALFRTVKPLEKTQAGPRHEIEISRAAAQAAARSGRLPVVMPDGTRFEAEVVRTETSANGVWTLVARVDTGRGWQSAVISFGKDATFGALPLPSGGVMRIATTHGRSVIERDGPLRPDVAAKAGGESLDIVRPPLPKAGTAVPLLSDADALAIAKSGPVAIDVLAVYTTELVAARGSTAAVETEFTNLFAIANQAYADSGTVVRLNLVGFRQTGHGADIGNVAALEAIRSNGLSDIDIWAERDATHADLVAMLRSYDGGSSCGVGYLNGGGGNAESPQPAYGYSVSNAGNNCSLYTLAHELGHNLGSTHDRANSFHGDGAYLFSHGYRQPGPPAFATVMAYPAGAWQERVGYFSQPGTSLCKGVACGVAEQSDNVRSLNLMAPRIALFRTPADTLAIHDSGVIEPVTGFANVWHVLQLSTPAGPEGVMVQVSTADGTATAGEDYVARSTSVRFSGGQTTAYFHVEVLADDEQETDETYFVNIESASSPVVVNRAQGVGHIKAATLTLEDLLIAEGDYGSRTVQFRVLLSQAQSTPVSFDIATMPGTATAGSDYVARNLVGQQIPAGVTEYLFDVEVAGDPTPEANESFEVRLSNVTGAVLPRDRAYGRILNDDYRLSVADATFVEGNGGWTSMTVPIRLSSPATEAVRFNISLADGLATEGADFDRREHCGPCNLPAGETEFDYTVWINGDQIDETDEHFTVSLTDIDGAQIGRADGTVFIDDDDGAVDVPLLAVGDLFVDEGNAGTTPANIVVSLSAPAPVGGVRFDLATSDGTAVAGSDYLARTLAAQTIPAGQRSTIVTVQVNGDTTREPDETFNVTVSNVSGAALADGEAVVTVRTDELPPPTLSVSDVTITEDDHGDTAMFFQVTMSSPSQQIVSFDVTTADGTATSGSAADGHDYELYVDTTQWTILPGRTWASIGVNVRGDLRAEPDETFTVKLGNPVGAEVLDGQATGTILDNDRNPPVLRARGDRVVVLENGAPVDISILANDVFSRDRMEGGLVEIFQPSHGQAELIDYYDEGVSFESVRYTPPTDFSGETSFRYRICEAGRIRCTEARVEVVVRPVLDFRTQNSTGAGFAEVYPSNLRSMPEARYRTTPLVSAVTSTPVLQVDATPESPWNAGRAGTAVINRTISESNAGRDWRIVVDARGEAGEIDVYLGAHSDADGVPVVSETRCTAATQWSWQGERCELTLSFPQAGEQSYWVMVHNLDTEVQAAKVEIFEVPLDAPSDSLLLATGPRLLSDVESFGIRMAWNDPHWLPGESKLAFVEIQGGAGEWGMFPIRIDRNGADAPPQALTDKPFALTLAAGMAQDMMFVDVPAGASALTVTTASAQNVDLYLAHDPAPSGPDIPPAPARGAAQASAIGAGGNESLTVSGAALKPGRWYVTPVNADALAATLTVKATITGTAPTVRPGSYFNAARSGHGLFLYPAGDSFAGLWYTFLQNGAPTWYYLQGLKPGANGIWYASLYRASWNGSINTLTAIGNAVVTPNGPDAFQFTFHLDGQTGSEPLAVLGRGCPPLDGATLDASSHWFNPGRPGPGYSVQLFPDYEFYAAFVFDARGVPRFLVAESPRFAGAEATLDLEMINGFCPLCPRMWDPYRSVVGTMTRRFSDGRLDHISMDAIYTDEPYSNVPGTWTSDETVQTLGGPGTTQGCQP